jgi:AT-rich interactive domain-containing protein 1
MSTHVTTASGGSVTSVVTTGPDGTPIDEGSQQSTLSNASAGNNINDNRNKVTSFE